MVLVPIKQTFLIIECMSTLSFVLGCKLRNTNYSMYLLGVANSVHDD